MHCKEVLVRDPICQLWVTLMFPHINTSCNLNLWTMQTGKLHGLGTGAVSGYFLPFPETVSRMVEKRQFSQRAKAPRIQ